MATERKETKPAILLVDDEPKTLKNFSRFYRNDYRVYLAESAQEATEELYAHPGEIGVVICDERMPLVRGVDFLARLAREQPQIIQILTTAYTDVEVLQQAVNLHIHRYVPKPWDYDRLTEAIDSAIDLHRERKSSLPLRNPFTILRDIAGQSRDATQLLELLIDTDLTPLQIHYVSLITLIAAHIQTTSSEIAEFFDQFDNVGEFRNYRVTIMSDEPDAAEQVAGQLEAIGLAVSVTPPGVNAPADNCTLLAINCKRFELAESALIHLVSDIHNGKVSRPAYMVAYCDACGKEGQEKLQELGVDTVMNQPVTALDIVHYLARFAKAKHTMNRLM